MTTFDAFLSVAPPKLARWLRRHEATLGPMLAQLGPAAVYPLYRSGGYDTETRQTVYEQNGTLTVNDTFYISSDTKRFVVFFAGLLKSNAGSVSPVILATSLAGADGNDSQIGFNAAKGKGYGSSLHKLRFETPVFYGKQAKKRYDAYVMLLTKSGNADLAVPFESADSKPEEPEPPLPESDVATPEEADVVIRHTVEGGTVMLWDHAADRARPKDRSIWAVARSGGFVAAHSIGGVYRRTNSVGTVETRAPVARMVDQLHAMGLKVYLDLGTGSVAAALAAKRAHLEARAERYEARGERLASEAEARGVSAGTRREQESTHREFAGFFPTPPDLAAAVVELADLESGQQVLEPSAGHGALVRAARTQGVNPDAIEIQPQLRADLERLGVPIVAFDIMDPEFQPGTYYDRILMNPPFENGQSIDHVLRAWSFLAPGGRLVAVMPESVVYRQDRKHEAFRAWVERWGGELTDVERQKFGRSGEIKTRVFVVDKPASQPIEDGTEDTYARIEQARASVVPRERAAPQPEKSAASKYADAKQRIYAADSRGRNVTKADMAELKALEVAAKAEYAAQKAANLEQAAGRLGSQHVLKGGIAEARKIARAGLPVERKAPRPRAPKEPEKAPETFIEHIDALMPRLPKRVGASKVQRIGHYEAQRVATYEVTFKGVGSYEGQKLRKRVTFLTGASSFGKEKPPFSFETAWGGEPHMEQIEEYDPPALFEKLVAALNADSLVQKVRG